MKSAAFKAALAVFSGVAVLVFVDALLVLLELFPPRYAYGDPELGWVPAQAQGRMIKRRCTEHSTGSRRSYIRNEDGIRTHHSASVILQDREQLKIAVVGDSHTDLCDFNSLTHPGVLERGLNAEGVRAIVLSLGSARYSPLQSYLLFKRRLAKYQPEALVLNFYTGNDFYDMLRIDDRPHFVASDGGYRIHEPVWYVLADPNNKPRSRILFVGRSLLDRSGLSRVYTRVSFLSAMAFRQAEGVGTVISYMADVRRSLEPSVGYPAALAAQILGQQLFFHHFPDSLEETLNRVRALMVMARRENPDMTLVMSPIPSYQLVGRAPVDRALRSSLSRLPITYAYGLNQESQLYYRLEGLARETGWVFVDNLLPLQREQGSERLYNEFDYHVTRRASAIIGENESRNLLPHVQRMRR